MRILYETTTISPTGADAATPTSGGLQFVSAEVLGILWDIESEPRHLLSPLLSTGESKRKSKPWRIWTQGSFDQLGNSGASYFCSGILLDPRAPHLIWYCSIACCAIVYLFTNGHSNTTGKLKTELTEKTMGIKVTISTEELTRYPCYPVTPWTVSFFISTLCYC